MEWSIGMWCKVDVEIDVVNFPFTNCIGFDLRFVFSTFSGQLCFGISLWARRLISQTVCCLPMAFPSIMLCPCPLDILIGLDVCVCVPKIFNTTTGLGFPFETVNVFSKPYVSFPWSPWPHMCLVLLANSSVWILGLCSQSLRCMFSIPL